MPRPHTLLPNDVHTALTCHTCAPTVMNVHTSTPMQISHRCPLCQLQTSPLAVHTCIFRPYAGITHQHLLLVPHMNTCIPFQYTLESVLTQHTPKCTLVQTSRPHTSTHLLTEPLSPMLLLQQQGPSRALELLCPRGNLYLQTVPLPWVHPWIFHKSSRGQSRMFP